MTMPLLDKPIAIRAADLRDGQERARLTNFVTAHADATPFHLPAWSIAVAQGCSQKPHYLVAEGADGALCGVLPLIEIASPLFGRAMVSSGFGVGGGVIADDAAGAGNGGLGARRTMPLPDDGTARRPPAGRRLGGRR